MSAIAQFAKPSVTPRLGGSPVVPSSEPQYPWADGELLYAEALNAAIANILSLINGNALPTTAPPAGSGLIWNNGGVLMVA